MRLRPMPVVMVSSLTERGSEITLRALELGAVDFVTKPRVGIRDGMLDYAEKLADKIRAASRARVRQAPQPQAAARATDSHPAAPMINNPLVSTEKLIIIGASTGGTEAIREVLTPLPPDAPAVLIAQHMPPGFTKSFAQRLNGLCRIAVKEAEHGERVLPGHAYIAPGHAHLLLAKRGELYCATVGRAAGEPAPPVGRRAVPLGGDARGQERARGDPDRDGPRRRGRPAGNETRGRSRSRRMKQAASCSGCRARRSRSAARTRSCRSPR